MATTKSARSKGKKAASESQGKIKTEAQIQEERSKRALGALLGFYRRTRFVQDKVETQEKVATVAGLEASALGMFESGLRRPTQDAIERLAVALGLNAFQSQQLQLMNTYSPKGPIIGEQWFVPEDVLTGTPVFLRDLKREPMVQSSSGISEMWIITSRPLAIDGEMYEVLKSRLLREEIVFTYFIDTAPAEAAFQDLWKRLGAEVPRLKATIDKQLQCVLVPSSFCLYHYAICNPGQVARMFGRMIIYASGLPLGYLSMDSQQVSRAYDLLATIHRRLQSEEKIDTDYGQFRRVKPQA